MRRLSVLYVCTRERTPTPTRSYANWNWTMRPNEGSWLSILTQSRCVCVRLCINVCFNDWMLGLCGDLFSIMCVISSFSECRVSGGGQYPFTRYASRPLQYPHSGHPTSRGSASVHTEEEHHFWVGILLFVSVSAGKLII